MVTRHLRQGCNVWKSLILNALRAKEIGLTQIGLQKHSLNVHLRPNPEPQYLSYLQLNESFILTSNDMRGPKALP